MKKSQQTFFTLGSGLATPGLHINKTNSRGGLEVELSVERGRTLSQYINPPLGHGTININMVNMVEATSPSLEQGNLPQLVRHPSKESKAEETRKKGRMITQKKTNRQ